MAARVPHHDLLSAGLNLSGGQKDGRQKQNATSLRQAGPGVHRQAAGGGNHLLRDFQRLPSDGEIHAARRRWAEPLRLSHFLYPCFRSSLFLVPSTRQDYRHRQSAEAGAGKGLKAAAAACMEFFHSFIRGETLPEPTQSAALSLHTTLLKRTTDGGQRHTHRKTLNQFL